MRTTTTTRLNFLKFDLVKVFFECCQKIDASEASSYFFFSKKVSAVIFIKGLKPRLKRKVIKLLTFFDNFFLSLILWNEDGYHFFPPK